MNTGGICFMQEGCRISESPLEMLKASRFVFRNNKSVESSVYKSCNTVTSESLFLLDFVIQSTCYCPGFMGQVTRIHWGFILFGLFCISC